ncbi:hypothetical protein SAMN05216365_14811 [Porphyromonadaceae bacterium NLAE-zl-C104]|uniref:hypothetical protein n=1 Tax=Proteiniphilum saccharofermentans TaxID=1642647 RepID=UPI0008DED337|nr:hypothetical protein [Proteiniphilum saccharofermentans]SFT04666.1 hypothetical protein SAMN05216365_14811 [Porphyromonadaceae bacterium NLAE-zl-C104]
MILILTGGFFLLHGRSKKDCLVGDINTLKEVEEIKPLEEEKPSLGCGSSDVGYVFSLTAIDLYTNPKLIEAAKAEFEERRGKDFTYVSLLGDRAPALDYRVKK